MFHGPCGIGSREIVRRMILKTVCATDDNPFSKGLEFSWFSGGMEEGYFRHSSLLMMLPVLEEERD